MEKLLDFFSPEKISVTKFFFRTESRKRECHQNDKDFVQLISLTNRIKVPAIAIKLDYKTKCNTSKQEITTISQTP